MNRRFAGAGDLKHLQVVVQDYQARGGEVHIIDEACGFGYAIAWRLEAQQAHVIVVPPSTVERAPGAQVKTDGLDASKLALKYEKGVLNEFGSSPHFSPLCAAQSRERHKRFGLQRPSRHRGERRRDDDGVLRWDGSCTPITVWWW